MEPESDAEVVSEGPKTPAPPPRVAELKPAGEQFGVFDGPVDDPPNVKRKAAGEASAARTKTKAKGQGQKRPEPAPPPPDPEEARRQLERARRQAEQAVDGFVEFQLMLVRERYGGVLEADNLELLCDKMRFTLKEREMWVDPLAEGFLENGVVFPWWARLGIAAVITIKARQVLLVNLEAKMRERAAEAAAAEAEKKP